MSEDIVIRKLNLQGEETWRYIGRLLAREPDCITLEAFFNRDRVPVEEIVLMRGDRFVESFYNDRWYNIFEIHDGDSPTIKGWYCNVARPAVIQDGEVSYIDLALDLLVYPDGRQVVLDEDEFEALALDAATRQQALEGLEALKRLFSVK